MRRTSRGAHERCARRVYQTPRAAMPLGAGATAAATDSLAFGLTSETLGDRAVALGASASATGFDSVALGAGSVADEANTVSFGSDGNERKLTNVANGTVDDSSTDVVTGRQLFATNANVTAAQDAADD
ncbi:MAG: hypothetical protein AAFP81_13440, partial [Pseudomonadota bacterium]